MESEEYTEPIILEYEPLSQLRQSLPRRHGLLLEDVLYTCLDVSTKYLVLGSTKGLVAVYELSSWQHKTFHESKQSVTVVKLNPYVQAVAVGCSNGDTFVILFGSVRDAESPVKRYVIREPDHVTASALEWEEGGERLLIGYTNGKLVQAVLQFEKGTCDSTVVLQGSWNICQLSLCHSNLLISTLTCTLLMEIGTGRLKQVGQGQRKEGAYGGSFGLHDVGSETAFVARPGFRIWSVNSEGEVVRTYKLKDEILSPTALPIMFLGQEHKYIPPSTDSAHFSLLFPWHSRYLVTYWQTYLWVLDPVQCKVIGALRYPRSILGVATCKDDIYMLSRDKNVLTKLSMRFDLQRFKPHVILPIKDEGTEKEVTESVDSGTPGPDKVKGSTTLEGTEDRLQKSTSIDGPELLSSAKARPLALMERDQQMKRLADFNTEQDISMLVKQVKKKGKKKGPAISPQAPHRLVSPVPPMHPPSPKEYPKLQPREAPSIFSPETAQSTGAVSPGALSQVSDSSRSSPSTIEPVLHSDQEIEKLPTPDPTPQPEPLQEPAEQEDTPPNLSEQHPESTTVAEVEVLVTGEEATDGDAAVLLAAEEQSLSTAADAEGIRETVSPQIEHGRTEEGETSEGIAESEESSSEKVSHSPLHHLEVEEDRVEEHKEETTEEAEADPLPVEDRAGDSDDFWIPLNLPPSRHSITAIAASKRHLWALDSKGSVFHRLLTVKGGHISAEWNCDKSVNLTELSAHIDGDVLWGVSSKGIVVKTLVPQKGAMVLQGWETIGTSKKNATAASVTLGSNGAWVVSEKGEILYRSGVSSSCPKGTLWHVVEEKSNIVKLSCCGVVLWAVTKDRKVLVRSDFSEGPLGSGWQEVSTPVSVHNVYVSMDTVWIVGEDGRVFFRYGITEDNPDGCDPWWNVCTKTSVEETESTGLQRFVHPAQTLQSLKSWFVSEGPIAVAAITGRGVWVLDGAGRLSVCLSTLAGSHYVPVTNDDLFNICTWSQVAAGGVSAENKGVAWLLRDDGELYSCNSRGEISKMAVTSSVTTLAASSTALWVVTEAGSILSREGTNKRHPLGTTWENIEMMQLGGRQICSVGLGYNCAWAVDETGEPWFRFDVAARDKESGFAQVWLEVEQKGVQHPFVSVAVGPSVQYVWAVDTKHNIYVRMGVTAEYPVGRQWRLVEGAKGKYLCPSARHVWVLAPDGSLLCREGVDPAKIEGRAWKRIPGEFERISCTQDGQVWGVCNDGTVVKRQVKVLQFEHGTSRALVTDKDTLEETVPQPTGDIQGWEVL